MDSVRDRIYELSSMAAGLPYGPTAVSLLSEAVQLADSLNDIDLAFQKRDQLMNVATCSARPDIVLVAFSWCLAQYDRDPKRFDLHGLLWKYKWVVSTCVEFASIDRQRLEDLFNDMERRYREFGSTMNGYLNERRCYYIKLGERENAKAAHVKFRKSRRDSLSDCLACVANKDSEYYCSQRQWKKAVEAVEPVLSGRLRCSQEPHRILAQVLLPLLYLRRYDEAKQYHRMGIQRVRGLGQFVLQQGEHLRYLALTGQFAASKRLFERHLQGALDIISETERFEFFLASNLWIQRLSHQGTRTMKVRLPKGVLETADQEKVDVHALGEWFAERARDIASRFDQRNGTHAFQDRIDEIPDLLRLSVD